MKIFKKSKTLLAGLGILTAAAFVLAGIQSAIVAVSADIVPIVVLENQLDFGPVFPGEGEKTKNFSVRLTAGYDGEVFYQISQQIKPRPDVVVPAGFSGSMIKYCQSNPDDLSRCFQNLCPYLTKHSDEGEGDLENKSSVGPGDLADLWSVNLAASAIFGAGVPQSSGVISEPGVYGCDVSVALLPTPECTDNDGDGFFAEGGGCGPADCDDGQASVHPEAAEICDDQIDNNCDGLVDSADSACPAPPVYQCSDGIDNDGDGKIDYPDDAGCAGATDNDETNVAPPVYQCSDGIDNDGDGAIDYPDDLGCISADDDDEINEEIENGESGGTEDGGTKIRGGAGPRLLVLHTESAVEAKEVSVMVIWFTSYQATSRVVYDTAPHPDINYPPNYGYAFSTIEDSNKVTYHQVTITGLTPGTTYYWRGISHGSPEVITSEFKFVTQAASAVVPTPAPELASAPALGVPIGEQAWQLPIPGEVLGVKYEEGKGKEPVVSGNVGVGTEDEGRKTEDGTDRPVVEVEDLISKETVEVATTSAATTEGAAETMTCKNLIWPLLILNLLLTLAIYWQERNKKQNFWAVVTLLIVVPVIIWYPACDLIYWLLGLAVVEILYLIWQGRRRPPAGFEEISGQDILPPTPLRPASRDFGGQAPPVPTSPSAPPPPTSSPAAPTSFRPTDRPGEKDSSPANPALPKEKSSEPPPVGEPPPFFDNDFFPPIE